MCRWCFLLLFFKMFTFVANRLNEFIGLSEWKLRRSYVALKDGNLRRFIIVFFFSNCTAQKQLKEFLHNALLIFGTTVSWISSKWNKVITKQSKISDKTFFFFFFHRIVSNLYVAYENDESSVTQSISLAGNKFIFQNFENKTGSLFHTNN